MALRAQASGQDSQFRRGKAPSLGQLELPVRAVSPGAGPQGRARWNRKRRDKIIWREGRQMSCSLVSQLPGTLVDPRMCEIIDCGLTQGNRSERQHLPRGPGWEGRRVAGTWFFPQPSSPAIGQWWH